MPMQLHRIENWYIVTLAKLYYCILSLSSNCYCHSLKRPALVGTVACWCAASAEPVSVAGSCVMAHGIESCAIGRMPGSRRVALRWVVLRSVADPSLKSMVSLLAANFKWGERGRGPHLSRYPLWITQTRTFNVCAGAW